MVSVGEAKTPPTGFQILLDQVPVAARIGQDGAASDRGAVHGPDRRQAAVVLPKNIGLAVAVEIGRRQRHATWAQDWAGPRHR